jgi:hypothetical protein
MKKLLKVPLLIALLGSMFFTACKKQIETKVETPSLTNSQPIIIRFDKTNLITTCSDRLGICVEMSRSRDEWANYSLLLNEGKGDAWATDLGADGTAITFHIGTTKFSRPYADTLKATGKYEFAEDTYMPKELIAATYKNAGIPNPPSEIKIAKGKYPITFLDTPPNPPVNVNKLVIKITITLTNGKVTNVRIEIKWIDP